MASGLIFRLKIKMNDQTFECRAAELDRDDPIAVFRQKFSIPVGQIYLDGNSLGACQNAIHERVERTLKKEWGESLISSWNQAGWFDWPVQVGDKIAPLIGAGKGQVAVGDSTSVNLFKGLDALCQLQPDRQVIVVQEKNFATDGYMAQALARINPKLEVRYWLNEPLESVLDEQVACLLSSQVDYRTSERLDMSAVNRVAHAVGARVCWDLSHSTGAIPVDVLGAESDIAVGCTYKYLNGGPGAPSYVWVHPDLIEQIQPALPGWMGDARPFEFQVEYQPHPGIRRMVCGTPQILSLAALDAALDLWSQVDLAQIDAKRQSLMALFETALGEQLPGVFEPISPSDPERRGSHLSFSHPNAYPIVQALIDDGVVGDYRDPSYLRFGFAPLYLSHSDVLESVNRLARIMREERWKAPEFQVKKVVT